VHCTAVAALHTWPPALSPLLSSNYLWRTAAAIMSTSSKRALRYSSLCAAYGVLVQLLSLLLLSLLPPLLLQLQLLLLLGLCMHRPQLLNLLSSSHTQLHTHMLSVSAATTGQQRQEASLASYFEGSSCSTRSSGKREPAVPLLLSKSTRSSQRSSLSTLNAL
jgi:hypothetical protein